MFKKLLRTKDDLAVFILRVMLGIAFLPHGAQKVLGWFGGHGFNATMSSFVDKMHIPYIFALLAILAESLGAVALITGFLTRIAAFGMAAVMAVAIYMVHGHNGFFMNWSGAQKGEGFEYHFLVLAIAIALMIKGGGSFSIDRKISK